MNLPVSHSCGFGELGRALGRLTAFRGRLESFGVTPLEYQALLLIKTSPDERITVGALARRLTLQKSLWVQLADRLVENGLVLRRPSGRTSEAVLQIAPRGAEVLAVLAVPHLEELRAAERILTAARPPTRET